MSSTSALEDANGGGGKRRKVECHEIDADSLCVIGDDGLSSILRYLDPPNLGRLEVTCRSMRSLATGTWESLSETESFRGSVSEHGSRVEAGGVRAKVIKWYLASRYAERIEPLVPTHLLQGDDRGNKCQGCNAFPDRLDRRIFSSPKRYELFLRLATKSADGVPSLKFQGFVPFGPDEFADDGNLTVRFDDLDLSEWTEMQTLLSLEEGSDDTGFWDHVLPITHSLLVLAIAVPKLGAPGASLVQGMYRFPNYNIDVGYVGFWNENRGMNGTTHEESRGTENESWTELIWTTKSVERFSLSKGSLALSFIHEG